jgi:hypothetical protein
MTIRLESLPNDGPEADIRRMGVVGAFGVVGGPIAWYAQLCAGYALASSPCFADGHLIPSASAWTWSAMVASLILGVLAAAAAGWVSLRFLASRSGTPIASSQPLIGVRRGRTHFLALWGALLGGGFAVASLVGVVAYIVLPRCGG